MYCAQAPGTPVLHPHLFGPNGATPQTHSDMYGKMLFDLSRALRGATRPKASVSHAL